MLFADAKNEDITKESSNFVPLMTVIPDGATRLPTPR